MNRTEIAALFAQDSTATYMHELAADAQPALEFADHVLSKNAFALRYIYNGLNPAAKATFEKVTGVKLPKTQKECWAALKAWAGITDTQESLAEANAALALIEKKLTRERNDLSQRFNNVAELEQYIQTQFSNGYNRIHTENRKRYLANSNGHALPISTGSLAPASDFIVLLVEYHDAQAVCAVFAKAA